MNTRIKGTCTALIATLTVGALAPAAQAQGGGYKTAEFEVTAKGTQQVEWLTTDPEDGRCAVTFAEEGTEKVKFKTTKPTVITAVMAPGDKRPTFVSGKGLPRLKAKATVNRNAVVNLGPTGPEDIDCPGGPGGADPIPRDCGTKSVAYPLALGWDYSQKDRFVIESTDTKDPFVNCAGVGSDGFPFLLSEFDDENTTRKLPKLPASEVFDEEIGKLIVIGRAKAAVSEVGHSSIGSMQWDVTLKRIKEKK